MIDIMEEQMDTSWIKKFEDMEKDYDLFYKDNVCNISAYFLYVNQNNILEKISQENLLLDDENTLSKETIISLIKKYQCDKDIEYKLLSLLKYNITLEPDDIGNFLDETITEYQFIQSVTTVQNIKYNPTISIFQDLNSLYFIFYDFPKKLNHSNTKKVFIKKKTRRTKKRHLKTPI